MIIVATCAPPAAAGAALIFSLRRSVAARRRFPRRQNNGINPPYAAFHRPEWINRQTLCGKSRDIMNNSALWWLKKSLQLIIQSGEIANIPSVPIFFPQRVKISKLFDESGLSLLTCHSFLRYVNALTTGRKMSADERIASMLNH